VDKLLLNVKDSVSRSSQFDAATHDARVPLSKLTDSANSAIHSLQSLQSLQSATQFVRIDQRSPECRRNFCGWVL
jgi:K+-sensing histidine kinase KdpD